MPGKTYNLTDSIYQLITSVLENELVGFATGGQLNLGGTEGEDGGSGGPPRPIIGQLPQKYVSYDTSEGVTPELYGVTRSGWSNSLLDNLNHIRYRMQPARWFDLTCNDTYTVVVNPGIWWLGSANLLDFTGGDIVISAPDTQPRIDVIYISSAGVASVYQGTPAASPSPSYPSTTYLPVAEIYIYSGGTPGIITSGVGYTYQSGYAQAFLQRDIRPFLGDNNPEDGVQYLSDLLDVSSQVPLDNESLVYNDNTGLWRPLNVSPGGIGGGHPTLQIDGPIVTLSGVGGAYICTRSGEFDSTYLYCETPGISGATIIDVNKNGVSLFSNPANRPVLNYDDANKVYKATISGMFYLEEDIITVDIDQVAVDASDMTVVVALDVSNAHPHSDGPHTGVLNLDELQDGSVIGLPLLAGGAITDPHYGQVSTSGIAPQAVDWTRAGEGVVTLQYRQGGSATSWATAGTSNYTISGRLLEQVGTISQYIYPPTSHTVDVNVTFPQAYTYNPAIIGNVACATNYNVSSVIKAITNTGFTVTLYISDDTPSTLTYFWRAMGEG